MQPAVKPADTVNWTQNFYLVQQLFSEVMPGVTTTLTSVTGSDHQAQSDMPVSLDFISCVNDQHSCCLSLLTSHQLLFCP